MTIKAKNSLWMALLASLLLFATGCPVDVNEADPGGDDTPPPPPECADDQVVQVRLFHAAAGTRVLRPDFLPESTPNLNFFRTAAATSEAPAVEDEQLATLANGRAAYAFVCAKATTFTVRVAGTEPALATVDIALVAGEQYTIIAAGYVDAEAPGAAADPIRLIALPEDFSAGGETQVSVVHASVKSPDPIDVDLTGDTTPEIVGLARYSASALTSVTGSSDAEPTAVAVNILNGLAGDSKFRIIPRVPAGAKFFAIHYHVQVFDPLNPSEAGRNPKAVSRLFLTGDDPLLGLVPGGGVTFTATP
jgi:hypothetical protein